MKLLHHKSPLWAIAFTALFYCTFSILFYEADAYIELTTAKVTILCVLLAFFVGYMVAAQRSRESSLIGSLFTPAELYNTDEAFRAITQRATQRVYVFLSYGLPLLVLLAFAANFSRVILVIAIGVVHVASLCVYAVSTRILWADRS